jgi:hypothetical protein
MKQEEAIQEVLKGLEGLQMLGQWQLSLVNDLLAKTRRLCESAKGGGESDESKRPLPE